MLVAWTVQAELTAVKAELAAIKEGGQPLKRQLSESATKLQAAQESAVRLQAARADLQQQLTDSINRCSLMS